MLNSKEQFQEPLITRVEKEVDAVPQLEYAYYRFNINLQRYYSLTLLKSAYTIGSLVLALIFAIPCFQNYFLITECTWIINSLLLKIFYTSTPQIMTFRTISTFVFLLMLFFLFSYLLISQERLWNDGWMVEVLWTIHLIFYCFLLQALIKIVLTWLRYRKWCLQIVKYKKYELKELLIVSLQSIPHKSSKELKLNSQKMIRSKSNFKEKNAKPKQNHILSYSSMKNIK